MIDLLFRRRSTRKFQEKKVEDWQIKKLLTAALLSPSSGGKRPWEFIVVDDPVLLGLLSEAKPGAKVLKNAPLAIIVTGDKAKSDVWVEDCSIASIFIQLEAEVLDLGSCWVQVHRRFYTEKVTAGQYIRQQMIIPERLDILSIIAIGYKDVFTPSYTENDLLWEKVPGYQTK